MFRTAFAATIVLSTAPLLGGCAATTTRLAPVQGQAAYEIECIREGDCWLQARKACNGSYRMLERHDNSISESELPGLNTRTVYESNPKGGYQHVPPATVGTYGPDFEASEPLPLTNVVVLCTAG